MINVTSQKKEIFPRYECQKRMALFPKIEKIDHPFFQGLIETGGLLTDMNGLTFMGVDSLVYFKVYEDEVVLECISTMADERGKGSATKVMQAILEVAKQTNTIIRIFACNVTGNGWMMMQHPAIAHGMVKKGKIPVAKLHKWYEKLGFKNLGKDAKRKGYHMVFNGN